MATATFHVGDVFERLADLPDQSVDLVMTSPPFLALRAYLPDGHPDKAKEIGTEATPADFLDTLLRLTVEWRRVLAPHGSICVELGDTWAGSGGAGGDYNKGGLRDGQNRFAGSAARGRGGRASMIDKAPGGHHMGGSGWPLPKSMAGIPHSYHLSLAYGRNVLRAPLSASEMLDYFDDLVADNPDSVGDATDLLLQMRSWVADSSDDGHVLEIEPWRIRNVIAWCRPNPPVGALGDKVRPATSYMTVACVSGNRWFDLDAIRHHNPRAHEIPKTSSHEAARVAVGLSSADSIDQPAPQNQNGAPPLDHWWFDEPDQFNQDAWLISARPYQGAHYAVFPPELAELPIKSMCPQRVCTTCGEPSRRTHALNPGYAGRAGGPTHNNAEQGASLKGFSHKAYQPSKYIPDGWTDCEHDSWRPGVVLDPFGGSGTTAVVATGHGRDCILIDLDERNVALARERVGMFLQEAS